MALARLLAPEAFGMMAIIGSSGMIIHTITDIGVKESLIQHPRGGEQRYVEAAWWLAFGRSFMLYMIFFALGPLVARFYQNPQMGPLFQVAALGIIFDGMYSSNAYIALKEMKFGKWAVINHGGNVFAVIFTVVLAFFMRNVWALVIGGLAEPAFCCALSYVFCPHLPHFSWDREAARDLLHFSKGVFGVTFLNLIFSRADIFVLGKFYSAAQLGLYAMAVYLAQTPINYLINLLRQTLLPTFSKVQDDNSRSNRILLQVCSIILLLGLPTLVFVFFCRRALLTLILGQRYSVVSGPLVVAFAAMLLNALNNQLTTFFYAKGLPHVHRFCVGIMAITVLILIWPSLKFFGLVGGQCAVLASVALGLGFQLERAHHYSGLDLKMLTKAFPPSLLVCIPVIGVGLISHASPILKHPLANVFTGLVGCLIAYGLSLLYLVRRSENFSITI
jgi:O-antigen/teichoic acid export membrane protein